jgi:hypothetical protein
MSLKSWDELPLLPFLNVCRYMNYKDVFGTLPHVCKHFNNLLTGYEVELDEIHLDEPSDQLLGKLKDMVSVCKSLVIGHFRSSPGISAFLAKLEKSVANFWCSVISDTEGVQVLTSFVNRCSRLRSLSIIDFDTDEDFDWSLFTVRHTLEELHFGYPSGQSEYMHDIFYKFPQLKRLTLRYSEMICHTEDNDVIDLTNAARIEYFRSKRMYPRVEFLRGVKEIVLLCWTYDVINTLIDYLPQLNALEKLHFDYSGIDELRNDNFYEMVQPDIMERYLMRLIRAVSVGPMSLTKLKISNELSYNPSFSAADFDLNIIELLHGMPQRISYVEYKGLKVRYSVDVNDF